MTSPGASPRAVTVASVYAEHVVIMDEAIAVVERRSPEERRQASSIALAIGGIVGPVLASVAQYIGMPGGPTRLYLRASDVPPLREMTDVVTCWAADVPADVSALPGWPQVDGWRPVTFYPRTAVASVRVSRWCGLELTLDREAAREVKLPLPAWRRKHAVDHLTRAGYRVAG